MPEVDVIEQLRRAQDRLHGFLVVTRRSFSANEVGEYNDEIERLGDLLADGERFKVGPMAFRDAPGQPTRRGQLIGAPKPRVVPSTVLREHFCRPAMAAIEREIVERQRPTARIKVTPQELGNQYVDACLEVARAIAAITLADPVRRGAGVDAYTLRQEIGGKDGAISLSQWRADYELFVNEAKQDLSAPAVGILAGSGADTELGRRFLTQPESMIRHIALRELEEPSADILRVVLEGSFGKGGSDYLPQQLITDAAVVEAVMKDEDDAYVVGQQVDMALQSLNADGYVDADLFLSGGRVRITFAGIIWLRDHERVTMDEAKRQERVQVNIDNQNGTIYAISTGSGNIHQVIADPVSPGDWDSLIQALAAVQVPQGRIDELQMQLSEITPPPGFLKRWAEGTITEMAGALGATMMLAAGSEGAQTLMQLVNTYRS